VAITNLNSEDRLVQKTFADVLHEDLGWESVYAWTQEQIGTGGTLGRSHERETVLVRDLRAALERLNPELPPEAIQQAIEKLTDTSSTRTLVQQNQEQYRLIRNGVPVSYKDEQGQRRDVSARVIDFRNPSENRFLVVRELKVQGFNVPYYNRRADLVCFINGLPVVVIECKAVYKDIRDGFEENLTDYMTDAVIPHLFHHNAFLVVTNGEHAKYGSITSAWGHFNDWKRNDEREPGQLDAEFLLRSMFEKKTLLDLIENFVLFDESRPGQTRKIVARNHQVLGVNRAVESVRHQEELKREYPIEHRMQTRVVELSKEEGLYKIREDDTAGMVAEDSPEPEKLSLSEKAHPDLGKLGVFWHTQGSGKSYSMAFFVEKVRRQIPGNFTFVILTDREDLDGQIHRTFVGCAVADEKTPRAGSGRDLEKLLKENHRFIFTLIHKFRRETLPWEPWSARDDIIVLSDEAHRTQGGKLARVMRTALPNASFLGFTGTPIFKYDKLTTRIFGKYVSKYDFKRAEEDNATVRLVYENRGEKLGIARLDLNDRIAEKIDEANLDQDQEALLEKLMGQDYEVVTAGDRLEKIADDFVEHASARWLSGKAMMVCIDKVTCGRMLELIRPRWARQIAKLEAQVPEAERRVTAAPDPDAQERAEAYLEKMRDRIAWMKETLIHIVISESQNEVKDFNKWDIDIIPHRHLIKQGFTLPGGDTLSVDDAFKKPEHPFRVAIVCAMWLTGFDVECLQTLYIDKPMKAHTLMQAIARANRVFPGKDCGVIVDYNGMLKSLNAALAQYAVAGDDEESAGGEGPPAIPVEEQIGYLLDAIDATENHLREAGFEPKDLIGTTGFTRITLLANAVSALYANDETKRRFEILAREVFSRFKPVVTEPVALHFAERHDWSAPQNPLHPL
jgi:type I restriction enzyme R subunit